MNPEPRTPNPESQFRIPFVPALYSSSREGCSIDLLVLHYTAGPSLDHCVAWFRDPAHPVSCHYIVGTDGDIVQMVYNHDCAWHCGASRWKDRERCNPWALGIEIVNWGLLERRDDQFYCWLDAYTAPYDGPEPVCVNGQWWQPYPAVQVEQVITLSQGLIDQYRIPLDHVVAHSDIAPGRKIDPGPAFPWEVFQARLHSSFIIHHSSL